jgi:hypothetical protein
MMLLPFLRATRISIFGLIIIVFEVGFAKLPQELWWNVRVCFGTARNCPCAHEQATHTHISRGDFYFAQKQKMLCKKFPFDFFSLCWSCCSPLPSLFAASFLLSLPSFLTHTQRAGMVITQVNCVTPLHELSLPSSFLLS